MSSQQLQEYAKSLKQPRLVEFCLELANYIRRLEQQAELREELLKRSQKQVEGSNKTIEDKENKIERLEKDLTLLNRVERDIFVPEKDHGNKGLDDSAFSITEGNKRSPCTSYLLQLNCSNNIKFYLVYLNFHFSG